MFESSHPDQPSRPPWPDQPVAQLDRAAAFSAAGRGFESLRAGHQTVPEHPGTSRRMPGTEGIRGFQLRFCLTASRKILAPLGAQTGEQGQNRASDPGLFPLPLTDIACRHSACPADKARVRLTDGGGLYLEVAPNLSRRWFWKYYYGGKEKRLALGHYTDPGSTRVVLSLKAAREARDDARKLLRSGIDPAQQRQLDKLTRQVISDTTFESVARELHATKHTGWSPRYATRWLERMEKDLFPWIGSLPLQSITAPLLLHTLRRIESRGATETAHTLRQTAGQVFRYGIATGRCERNPAPDLHGALRPIVVKHMAAVLEPAGVGALMRAIATYEGQPLTRAALELSALLFQRPGNIRQMEWAELDIDGGLWTIPAAKMKRTVHGKVNGRPHLVPLPERAAAILRDLRPLTGHGRFVFPSLLTGERSMSENTLRTALRRMGYTNDEMTPHGFRAMARTILVEQLDVNPDVIEAQLAHGKSGPLGAAYDRAEFMSHRRAMMAMWADYLDHLRRGEPWKPSRVAKKRPSRAHAANVGRPEEHAHPVLVRWQWRTRKLNLRRPGAAAARSHVRSPTGRPARRRTRRRGSP